MMRLIKELVRNNGKDDLVGYVEMSILPINTFAMQLNFQKQISDKLECKPTSCHTGSNLPSTPSPQKDINDDNVKIEGKRLRCRGCKD
jgi:hypothetical protein